ncbi:MAG TPA: cyclopropane-fatty-acyl-phospholipid synthase family protein [Steroidobacteraceae bacterium]|nr:cyclopropane-fatty-acyl-phospholipid synthase family protein [Steroidobacteraceae bacterium]
MSSRPSIVPVEGAHPVDTEGSLLARFGRKLLLAQLAKLQHGSIRLIEPEGEHRFGTRTAECDLAVTVQVAHPQFFADVAFGGTVGAGEAYIRGLWRCDDLTSLVRIFVRNREVMNGMDGRWAALTKPFLKLFHALNRNSKEGSARNIAAHYDIGNSLYELMLDETMMYSCAIFPRADSSLHEAQVAKLDTICQKLALSPRDHLVEIGTGWGGLALHAAANYGCRVTTTTISKEQHDYAKAKIERLGLGNRIRLLFEDYRDLTGQYDKLVSIEMIEAVGANYLETYLRKCSSLLKRDGLALIQAITIQDQHYEQALSSVDYIQRFIFPGSFIPSVTAIAQALCAATDMKITHLEDIGPHYATTLRAWRERFFANLGAVRRLGLSDSFIRMWEFYLCYCEGGFLERALGDVHLLLAKPGSRRAAITYRV